MKNKRITFLIIALLFLLAPSVLAENIKVKAFVNNKSIGVGRTTSLSIEITGATDVPYPEVSAPDLNITYRSSSTQISIVNGRRTAKVTHTYDVSARQTGEYEIPAIEIKYKNKVYRTEPITIKIKEQGEQSDNSIESLVNEYLYMTVQIPRQKVYVNELVPITIKLYRYSRLDVQNLSYPKLSGDDFMVGDFPQPDKSSTIIDGKSFIVYTFKTTIQPVSAKTYNLHSIRVEADVFVDRQTSNNYSSFFRYDLSTVNIYADPIKLEVLDFPVQNKPEDFQGAVGQYQMDVQLSPKEVQVGEPITIRTKIRGQGNFKTVTNPVVAKNDNFKIYPGQPGEDAQGAIGSVQEKVFEQVVIPLKKVSQLPPVRFSYFDPIAERYVTLEKEELEIQVLEAEKSVDSQVMDYRQANTSEEPLGQDILYIKGDLGQLRPITQAMDLGRGAQWMGLILFGILLLGLGLHYWLNRQSPLQKRRQELHQLTKRELAKAEKLVQTGQSEAFNQLVYQVIQRYLKEYYQIAITGISDYEADKLTKAGVSTETVRLINEFYQKMDASRFAGYATTSAEMEKMLADARQIIHQVEQGRWQK